MSDSTATATDRTETHDTDADARAVEGDWRLRWGVYLILAAGVAYVVHGVGFLYRTFYTEGFELGVEELDGLTTSELAATNPEVASYLTHVHVSFAGLMIATGLGVLALTWFGVRRGQRWAWATALGIPLVFAAFTIPLHSTVHFHFDFLLHLGPAGVGLVVLVVGGVLSHFGLRAESGSTPAGGDR